MLKTCYFNLQKHSELNDVYQHIKNSNTPEGTEEHLSGMMCKKITENNNEFPNPTTFVALTSKRKK